jgi:hypothetical protein
MRPLLITSAITWQRNGAGLRIPVDAPRLLRQNCQQMRFSFTPSMKLSFQALCGAVLFGLAATSQAQLTWEKTEIELHPKPGDKDAVAVFRYENKGKTPVNIANVRSSCGCTVASLKKNDVQPGEKGELTATFNIGGRTGLQQKTVTVESDDPKQPVLNLLLKAVIAQPLELQPTFVYWQNGEALKPKKIVAKTGKEFAVKNLEVESSSPTFTAQVENGSSPGEFVITVVPTDTSKAANATLTIKGDLPQPYYATLAVTAPQAQPATAGR